MSATLPTSHADRSLLKAEASENIHPMLVTFPTSHADTLPLKA
eukprot:CAMPEP_0172547700 /NCGR_PEP_ID=MMETSP1067-20121228/17172_1 /TAXON_ID=265564 ORGANISM="Thalassiosira punctigera, Strain Tpunct2005C2" /NCGR_SAMPLE_ID=MMETSP1067 /ASSEMBLY_ACC=CAM_ASM_000444 /LENGTH=42 /DNA_ID= /DNA_START= /DNA_END= /DNA_ORIENTATION=